MNTIIDLFNDHKSERSFTDHAIDDATLERIISTAYRAPTSVHSQPKSGRRSHRSLAASRGLPKPRCLSPLCWICTKPRLA